MQILSYVNSNNSSSQSDITLEKLLKKQKSHRNQHSIAIENTKKIDFDSIKSDLSSFFKAFSVVYSKLKIVLFVTTCLFVLTLFVLYFLANISFSIKPIQMDCITENESSLLDKAMNTFVFTDSKDTFETDGTITNSGSSLAYAIQPLEYKEYVVKAGDNITRISTKFGLSNISTLIAVNNISNARMLQAGQKIKIPSTDGIIHTVRKNQSLSSISKTYGVTVEALLDVNDLATDVVSIGQQIFIPGAKLDSTSLKLALGELFICPLKTSWRLTSPYGYRADPFTGVKKFHTGMDMAAPLGTPVRAAMAGKVVAVSFNQVYGNYIIVSHINGYQTLYAHLHATSVKKGQRVDQGTKIGLLGSTGYSTGPHLHFTVYKNGKLVNPASLLK